MKEGELARFWLPARLAYGDRPTRDRVPAGPLCFDVKLLHITQQGAPAPAPAPAPGEAAARALGGRYRDPRHPRGWRQITVAGGHHRTDGRRLVLISGRDEPGESGSSTWEVHGRVDLGARRRDEIFLGGILQPRWWSRVDLSCGLCAVWAGCLTDHGGGRRRRLAVSAARSLEVDFTPRGGPPLLRGTFEDARISWSDGNAWTKLAPGAQLEPTTEPVLGQAPTPNSDPRAQSGEGADGGWAPLGYGVVATLAVVVAVAGYTRSSWVVGLCGGHKYIHLRAIGGLSLIGTLDRLRFSYVLEIAMLRPMTRRCAGTHACQHVTSTTE
jgi:hypothetical protein